jgi:methyl-accepting chemotaxis protein
MKWYSNQKIKNKLVLGFLAVAVIAALVGGFGMLTIAQIKANADKLFEENAMALEYAGLAAMKTQGLVSSAQTLSQMDRSTQKDTIEFYGEKMKATMDEVDGILEKLGSVVNEEVKENIISAIITYWEYLKSYTGSVIDSMTGDDGADLVRNFVKLANTDAISLTSYYTKLFETVSGEADARAASNNRQADLAMIIMCSVLAAGIVISILLGYAIAKSIGNPLKVMAAAGMRIAEGDVDVEDIMTEKDRALVSRKDEIGTLASMVIKLIDGTKIQSEQVI